MKKAFFAYSGDPITYGHIDLIERAAKKTDKLIVGFGINPNKRPSFSMREKIDMAKHVLSHIPNIDIVSYTGNIANFAFKKGISVIFRGIRNSSDLEAEKQLSDGCKRQGSDVEFEYLEAKNELADVSSTNVKGWAVAQGFIHEYVPLYVKQRVEARLLSQYPFGVTGSIATGKSTLSKKLREIGNKKGIPVFDLDLDSIAKSIYLASDDYEATREQIFSTFGHDLKNDDDSVNIKKLGSIVFNDDAKLDALNKIMYKPIKSTLQDHMIYRKGLIMHNAALLAELGMGFLCNNNVVVVDTSVEEQRRRLEERVSNGFMTKEQIERRLGSQYTSQKKKEIIQSWIDKTSQGKIWNVDSTRIKSDNYYELFFDTVIKPVDIYGELRFAALWTRINGDGFYDSAYQKIISSYLDPRKHHHDMDHIMMGVNAHDEFNFLAECPDTVLAAWFGHDSVMSLFSNIDEEKSGTFSQSIYTGPLVEKTFSENVKNLTVKGTKHHEIPKERDAKLLTCYDLMIFAQDYSRVLEYDNDIRLEYIQVPQDEFKIGRRQVLEKFADKNRRIFPIDEIADLYENKAKDNLQRLIKERYN